MKTAIQAKQVKTKLRPPQPTEVKENSFKIGQIVRVCQSPGLLLKTMELMPHNHDDPKEHFDSRVLGYDSMGRILIATRLGNNPHCSEWPWSENMVHPRTDEDWLESSSFQAEKKISFIWELPGFWDDEFLGRKVPGILRVAHIEPGDWVIAYEKPNRTWNTRVLNERQMMPR